MDKHKDREKKRTKDCPSVEEYMGMDEKEKDMAIQKAIIRLQNRIQEIIHMMESEAKTRTARKKDWEHREKEQ